MDSENSSGPKNCPCGLPRSTCWRCAASEDSSDVAQDAEQSNTELVERMNVELSAVVGKYLDLGLSIDEPIVVMSRAVLCLSVGPDCEDPEFDCTVVINKPYGKETANDVTVEVMINAKSGETVH